MKRTDRKSDCAINYSLENIGDPWSLLIVRDIVFFGKRTYGDFLASEERIGTSTLARRLKELEEKGILEKETNEQDLRIEQYYLSAKGLDLIPILVDLVDWGARHDPNTGASPSWIKALRKDRSLVIKRIRDVVKKNSSVIADYEFITGT